MRRATLLAVTLFLFSALVRPVIAQTGPLFDVRQNGAAGNGVALDTSSINKTIEACAAAWRRHSLLSGRHLFIRHDSAEEQRDSLARLGSDRRG